MMHLWLGGLGRNRKPAAGGGGGGGITVGTTHTQTFTSAASHALDSLSFTAGSTVIVACLNREGAPTASDGTNTYTNQKSIQRSGFANVYLTTLVAENVSGGSFTITVTPPAASLLRVVVVELEGTAASSFQTDTDASSNTDATNPFELSTAASVTSGHMVVYVPSSGFGGNTYEFNNSFTEQAEQGGGEAGGLAIGTWLATGTGVVTGSCTMGTATDSEQIILSFAPA